MKTLTKVELLNKINRSAYTGTSDITGECTVVLDSYETGVGIQHINGAYVYSIDKTNPESQDIQPGDVVFGYIKLYLAIKQGSKIHNTSATINQQHFDRFATSLMDALDYQMIDNEFITKATLPVLLETAIANATEIPVLRNQHNGSFYIYWSSYTHQPRYKIKYALNNAQNIALFEKSLQENEYYASLKYNEHYTVAIEDFFLLYNNEDIVRFGLRLTSDEFEYIIDTKNTLCISNTIESLAAAYNASNFTTIEDFIESVKHKKFTFMVQEEMSNNSHKLYETYVFGKEVK